MYRPDGKCLNKQFFIQDLDQALDMIGAVLSVYWTCDKQQPSRPSFNFLDFHLNYSFKRMTDQT